MRAFLVSVLFLAAATAQAARDVTPTQLDELCLAGSREGELAAVLEDKLLSEEGVRLSGAEVLTRDCGGQSLLEVLLETQQAENLEYAVIDMGVDIHAPLVREERGLLTLAQYLMQQAAIGRSPEVRAFALEYMKNFRDAEFNPNLYSLSMK